jgi:hypothetical protein
MYSYFIKHSKVIESGLQNQIKFGLRHSQWSRKPIRITEASELPQGSG